jgi:hypothetical protein
MEEWLCTSAFTEEQIGDGVKQHGCYGKGMTPEYL